MLTKATRGNRETVSIELQVSNYIGTSGTFEVSKRRPTGHRNFEKFLGEMLFVLMSIPFLFRISEKKSRTEKKHLFLMSKQVPFSAIRFVLAEQCWIIDLLG